MHDTPGGLVHSNFVRTTPPKTPLPQPSLRAGVVVADREGFEPSIPFLVYSLSRGALSTTQPPVLGEVVVDDGRSWNISAGFRQVGCIIIWRNFQIMKI